MQDDLFGTIEAVASTPVASQPPLLEFFNTNRESIGKVEFTEDGFLTFVGDVDASAKKFFEAVITYNGVKIKQYRAALAAIRKETGDERICNIIQETLS